MKKTFNIITGALFTLIVAMLISSATGIPALGVTVALVALAFIPKPTGVAMFNFADMLWADGEENMAGVKVTCYYALASEIEVWAALPASPSTAAEEVTLAGNFRMTSAKYWRKLYVTMQTGEVIDEQQGEVDGQSFAQKATVFYPGTKAEALAFAKNANNSNMVFIFEEVTGNRRVIGSEAIPARVKPSFTTGKAYADRKGMTLEIEAHGYTPAPLYDGVIELEGSTIS